LRVGQLEVVPVLDGVGYVDPTVFPDTTRGDWEAHREFLTPDGLVELSVGGFLIVGGRDGRVVLVDAGIASITGAMVQGGALLENLRSAGFETTDVTDVVFTHLHRDHIGWASDGGAAVFPKATYRCDIADWAWFVESGPESAPITDVMAVVARSVLPPIADRLEPWSGGTTLFDGVDVVAAPGHTPGNAMVVVSSGAARAVLLGDVVHCPVELVDTEWSGLADVDAVLAAKTREIVARELEGDGTPAAAAHFPGLSFGRLVRAAGVRQWRIG
jgi:glyoxylase-like metal-dependent hydrolase (beta-lactamase superfamily II)